MYEPGCWCGWIEGNGKCIWGCVQNPIADAPTDPHPRRHPEGTRSPCAGRRERFPERGRRHEPLAHRSGPGALWVAPGMRAVCRVTGFVMHPAFGRDFARAEWMREARHSGRASTLSSASKHPCHPERSEASLPQAAAVRWRRDASACGLSMTPLLGRCTQCRDRENRWHSGERVISLIAANVRLMSRDSSLRSE